MSTVHATKIRRLHQILWSKLDEHLLPIADSGVVLAVSGGPDSRALMESIASWPKRLNRRFVVAAINHGVRKAARVEAQFIALRAQRLGFDAHSEDILSHQEISNEEDLRLFRYRTLAQIARAYQCKVIVTAHHGDDDAEGYLMALMGRGGGEMGASMNEIEKINGLFLCRPFLTLSKQDLLVTLSLKNHTDFVTDHLDEARIGTRAYVRYEIMPELSRKAPSIEKRLRIFGKIQRENSNLRDNLAKSLIIWRDDTAVLRLKPMPERALLVSALWQILKKWGNGKDLRASQPTIDKIVRDLNPAESSPRWEMAGLDPTSNGFNLKDLNVKQYQFPGVLILRRPNDIHAMRI